MYHKTILTVLFALIVSALFTACTPFTDAGFSDASLRVRSDCRGDEIVGIWFRIGDYGWGQDRELYMFRPDGTGVMTAKIGDHDPMPHDFKWKYERDGTWKVWNGHYWSTSEHEPAIVKWTGDNLLYIDDTEYMEIRFVFYRVE